jgi:hypothetical protein
MSGSERETRYAPTSDFVKTHCRICAAGQTITRHEGGKATYCLLLREWMTDPSGNGTISGCDRFEAKEEAGAGSGMPPG